MRVLPTSWLEVSGFYSRVFAVYDSFTDQLGTDLSGQDVSGITPETFGGSMTVSLPQTSGYEGLRMTLGYHEASPATANATIPFPPPGRKSLDARLQFEGIAGTKADFAIWGSNLTDEHNSNGNDLVTGQITLQREDPRTYGIELRYAF